MRSPLLIEMMLACHCSKYPPAAVSFDWDSKPAKDALKFLRDNELIQGEKAKTGDFYRPTEKGRAWVEGIISTPLPVCQWEIPRTT